jgi:hypothetical protein
MVRAFVVPIEGGNLSLQLVVKPAQAPEQDAPPRVLAATDSAAVFAGDYDSIRPGGVVIELRSGDKVLVDGSVTLQPARAYTFVAWQSSSAGWQIKAFPDDPTTPNAADRAVRVLNFPAGRQTLLTIDQGAEIKVPANAVQEVRVAPKVTGAKVSVLAVDGGPPALNTMEMDFSTLKSGYIVVVPDNLGRMRPQFISGGYQEIQELAPEPAVASVPMTAEAEKQSKVTQARMEMDHQQSILNMIKARQAAAGNSTNATLQQHRRDAENKLAELKKEAEAAARSATTPPAAP